MKKNSLRTSGPIVAHGGRVGRQPAALGELVVAAQEELDDEDQEGRAGDLEEAGKVEADAARG